MKIVGFSQLHNELAKGNLHNWFRSMQTVCDFIYIYDQGSTDGSLEVYKQHPNAVVIPSPVNRFEEELYCKDELLQKLLAEHPDTDWIFWMDGDTILDGRLNREQLERELSQVEANAVKLGHLNLWRSDLHYRIDSLFHWLDQHGVAAFWRNRPRLKFLPSRGLHKSQLPSGIELRRIPRLPYRLIHRGFATDDQIIRRIQTYGAIPKEDWPGGQRQKDGTLARFLDESRLTVQETPPHCLPVWYKADDVENPKTKRPIREVYDELPKS